MHTLTDSSNCIYLSVFYFSISTFLSLLFFINFYDFSKANVLSSCSAFSHIAFQIFKNTKKFVTDLLFSMEQAMSGNNLSLTASLQVEEEIMEALLTLGVL